MNKANSNFSILKDSYLFSKMSRKVAEYKKENPQAEVISLGIGDVTLPLVPAVVEAMHRAVDNLGSEDTFMGYGPEQGHMFLRQAIAEHDYQDRGVEIEPDEIFISDGAKSDLGNISELFSRDAVVAIMDPGYPVYVDTNVMDGRAGKDCDGIWDNIVYLHSREDCGFKPQLPDRRPDIIYLCFPNNPTGTVLTRDELRMWVDYARDNDCIILYDSAYEAYIRTPDIPHSIYEISGADEVAIEIRSYSKTAGFTGVRCGYTVVPKHLRATDESGNTVSLNKMWNRRQTTKFNGASYISQHGAAAIYTPQGAEQIKRSIDRYMENAKLLCDGCREAGLTVYGGVDAPYVWVKVPEGYDSWQFFDLILHNCSVICTPGVGLGSAGESYVRLTAFNTHDNTVEAVRRIKEYFKENAVNSNGSK